MNSVFRLLLLSSAVLVLFGCGNPSTNSQSPSNDSSATTVTANQPFSYDDYADVLATYVDDQGLVDYQSLQANREQLDRFVASMGAVSPATYQSWSESERLAFLINAYNAFTLQSIIDQKPLKKSIRDIPGVWKWRKFKVAGDNKTLDNIEHNTIRKDFNEPRIHVALVCAAISCPPLRKEPYTGNELNQQLDDQVDKFVVSPHGFAIDKDKRKVFLSSIYKWFGEDWVKTYAANDQYTGNKNQKAVLNFLSGYLEPSDKDYLQKGDYDISYLNYDWSLNRQ